MIQRMGIFSLDSPDYKSITEQTFDWQQWIERESLQRCVEHSPDQVFG